MTQYLRPALLSLALIAAVAAPALAEGDGHDRSRWGDPYARPGYGYHQPGYGYGAPAGVYAAPILNERQIYRRLHRQGFNRVHDIDLRGNRYTARARDGHGRPVFLVVSAYNGQVLRVRHAW